ncbi:MAG: penicillin-binding protein activator LpoB [Planctomycetia bacterium]|nr:penicillin-binding protein activator LpoB [Planctomycetia bacterium]
MNRRQLIRAGFVGLGALILNGCRGKQFAKVVQPGDPQMVGSHGAGSETFKPLVDQAVGSLLARNAAPPPQVTPASTSGPEAIARPPLRICFVAVENKSAEEIGDFKDQIYQIIDTRIVESHVFEPINKRFVDAGLIETRLRPDQLFVPANMRTFVGVMEKQGQPFDYLLYATLTSGTTRENQNYQRDYLLTMEMINVRTGQYDKQSATLTKGYHQSRVGRLLN